MEFREYLVAFKPQLKNQYHHYLSTREDHLKVEPKGLHSEINKQFYEVMAKELASELARNFNTNPEEIRQFIETFNIEEWLNK